jgi:hypothetical protein
LNVIKLQPIITTAEKFQIVYTLGVINYQLYRHAYQQLKTDLLPILTITEWSINKNELLEYMEKMNMHEEGVLLALLDEALTNFTEMAKLLEKHERLSGYLYSLFLVMRTIENISSFYQLRFIEDKAMQAKLVVYVLAKSGMHDNAQMSCLAMFVEYPRIFEAVVMDFKLPQTVEALLADQQEFTETLLKKQQTSITATSTESIVAIEFLMQLAIFNASTIGDLDAAEKVLLRGRDIIKINHNNHQFVLIMKTHFYHTIFILTVKYNMKWFESMDNFPMFVLANFKQIYDIRYHNFFTHKTVMLFKMIPEYVQYAITRKESHTVEPYLYMILEYSIRSCFGLRSAQLLALSSMVDLDSEKLDVCEVSVENEVIIIWMVDTLFIIFVSDQACLYRQSVDVLLQLKFSGEKQLYARRNHK